MRTNTVNILIPAYKCSSFIDATIGSVRSQTYKNIHCTIILDGIDIESENVIRRSMDSDERFSFEVREHNSGWIRNVNTLLDLVPNSLSMLLPHDDCIAPDYIELLVGTLNEQPHLIAAIGQIVAEGDPPAENIPWGLEADLFPRMWSFFSANQSAPAFRALINHSRLPRELRLPDLPDFHRGPDVIWCAELLAAGPIGLVPGAHYFKMKRSNSVSENWNKFPRMSAVEMAQKLIRILDDILEGCELGDDQRYALKYRARIQALGDFVARRRLYDRTASVGELVSFLLDLSVPSAPSFDASRRKAFSDWGESFSDAVQEQLRLEATSIAANGRPDLSDCLMVETGVGPEARTQYWLVHAQAMLQAGEMTKAETASRKCLELTPNCPEAMIILLESSSSPNMPISEILLEADVHEHLSASYLHRLGKIFQSRGDIKTALSLAELAASRSPHDLRYLVRAAAMFESVQRDAIAQRFANEALRIDSNCAEAHHILSRVLSRSGEYLKALEQAERSIEEEPSNERYLANAADRRRDLSDSDATRLPTEP